MIDAALRLVASDLNGWFRRRRLDTGATATASADRDEGVGDQSVAAAYPLDPVVVSGLVEPDGTVPMEADDKIVLTVARIAEERNVSPRGMPVTAGVRQGEYLTRHTAPVYLDIHLLCAARFRRYEAGLGLLSDVIGYLQAKPVFTRENTPQMGDRLDRLVFTMVRLDYGEQNHLWGCLGAKYSPSVVYSVRLLPVGRELVHDRVPVVRETTTDKAAALVP